MLPVLRVVDPVVAGDGVAKVVTSFLPERGTLVGGCGIERREVVMRAVGIGILRGTRCHETISTGWGWRRETGWVMVVVRRQVYVPGGASERSGGGFDLRTRVGFVSLLGGGGGFVLSRARAWVGSISSGELLGGC